MQWASPIANILRHFMAFSGTVTLT